MRGREELDAYEWCYGVPLQVGNHVRLDTQFRNEHNVDAVYLVVAILYSKDIDRMRVALRANWNSAEAYISTYPCHVRPANLKGYENSTKMLYTIVRDLITDNGGTP